MKTQLQRMLALLCLTVLSACANIKYRAQITVRVVDDTNTPVTSGAVRVSTFAKWVRGEGFGHDEHDKFEAPINKDGIAVVEMRCLRSDIGYWPHLGASYYNGGGGQFLFKEVINGRWEPWNPQLEIIVPRILNPIALHARRVGAGPNLELPTTGPVGFDLILSDWVTPHGKGKNSDLIFTHAQILRAINVNSPFESVFTVTFSNPGDGIQSRLAKPTERLLELPREAPAEGYDAKLERRISWAGEGTPVQMGVREDQNYYFRVRTVFDHSGKVVSALYGKIHGDIYLMAPPESHGMTRFTYYLNPTPLDRNLEFNPKRNLFPKNMPGTNVSDP